MGLCGLSRGGGGLGGCLGGWLSGWLESGRWYLFGIYCLLASVAVWVLHMNGY